MPNHLMLTDRNTGETHQGRALIAVDEKLCEALGVPCHDVHFYMYWVDWMPLYMTNDWQKVREAYADEPKALAIIDWLSERYSLDGYATIGRR
jgi:hypothetical protein